VRDSFGRAVQLADSSVPQHPFSAGLTLAEFSAVSTDKDWNPTFVQNSREGTHKVR